LEELLGAGIVTVAVFESFMDLIDVVVEDSIQPPIPIIQPIQF